jgi:hypothetical protein
LLLFKIPVLWWRWIGRGLGSDKTAAFQPLIFASRDREPPTEEAPKGLLALVRCAVLLGVERQKTWGSGTSLPRRTT